LYEPQKKFGAPAGFNPADGECSCRAQKSATGLALSCWRQPLVCGSYFTRERVRSKCLTSILP